MPGSPKTMNKRWITEAKKALTCPRQDSNLRTGFRRAVLYPRSYEGGDAGSLPCRPGFQWLRSGNPACMSATRKARSKIDRVIGQAKEDRQGDRTTPGCATRVWSIN